MYIPHIHSDFASKAVTNKHLCVCASASIMIITFIYRELHFNIVIWFFNVSNCILYIGIIRLTARAHIAIIIMHACVCVDAQCAYDECPDDWNATPYHRHRCIQVSMRISERPAKRLTQRLNTFVRGQPHT